MKFITFNVNGLRSVLGKRKDGTKIAKNETSTNVLFDLLSEQRPDVLCLQEVRCNDNVDISSMNLLTLGYTHITLNCSTAKKGYSGTGIISKMAPLKVTIGFHEFPESHEINSEGRMITAEYDKYIVVNAYVPNSKADLSRLTFRTKTWENAIRKHIQFLQQQQSKTVIYCGDLNVAAEPIDVHNPSSAKGSHGFTDEERHEFGILLKECNLIDTFREKNPKLNQYSWFSPIAQSRKRGKGWRIDYVLVSAKMKGKIEQANILGQYYGSDHLPCMLEISL